MFESEMLCELMCRACLGSGRLYSIHQYQLADYYNQLIGTKVFPYDGLPQHLCAMCGTMLLKYMEFKKQCLEAELILNKIKKRQNVTTPNPVSKDLIHKKLYQTITKITEYPPCTEMVIDNTDIANHSDVKTIKNEVEISIDNFSMKVNENFTVSSSKFFMDGVYNNDEIDDNNEDFITTYKESKNENFDTNLDSKIDIEVAKKYKTKKDKTIDFKKDVKRKIRKDKDNFDEKKPKFKRAAKTNKIKGKYFETKENMANFEYMYEVEIIILSKEQQLNDVMDRKTSDNYINSPFKCQYCFKGFIDQDNLMKHFKSQHDPSRGDVICEFCKFRYKDKRGLNQHLKSHRLKFICRQCKYISRTTYNAKEHYKMHRGYMHECKDCGKSYEKLSTYLTHMRVHHPAELAWCDLCGEPFIGEFGLNGHKKRAHRDLKFPAECACACGAEFTNPNALHHHASTQGCGQTPCSHCGASFNNRLMLKDHLLENHKIVKKYYTCSKCTKTFNSESLYSAHYKRMHVDSNRRTDVARPWVCEVCGKTLPNKCRLVYHQRIHTGERPYQCPQCPKSFTMSKLLRSHARVHTTERPFACKFCPKTFKGPSALRGHEYMHTGGKMKTRNKNNLLN